MTDRFPITSPCPECGGRIVYNGNYFCSDCDWANPAVFPGKFTVAEADFADQLVREYTGRAPEGRIQQYATDARTRKFNLVDGFKLPGES